MADFIASRDAGLNNTTLRVISGARDVPRDPPQNTEAEKALIGAGLDCNSLFLTMDVEPGDFFVPEHSVIFETARSEVRAGRHVDAITLRSTLDNPDMEVVPGQALWQYLGTLTACAPIPRNLPRYCDVVREEAARRKLIVSLEDAVRAAWDNPASDIAELADATSKHLAAIRAVAIGSSAGGLFDLAGDAAEDPEHTPLIDRVLALGSAAILIAPWQAGKTFVLVRMAYAIALGQPFMGRSTAQGAVLLVPLEGRSGLNKRLRAANREYGDPGKLVGVLKRSGSLGPQPASGSFVAEIIAATKALAKRADCPARVVIIDTLAKALAGADENAASTMAAVWAQAARITAETGATVLFTHHPPHGDNKRPRGTGDIMGGADEVLLIERDGDERELHSIKQRDEKTGLICRFSLPVVDLGHDARGRPVTTCVVQQCDAGPAQVRKPQRPKQGSPAARALCELEELTIAGKFTLSHRNQRLPDGLKLVLLEDWRQACRAARLSAEDATSSAERQAFSRATRDLERVTGCSTGQSCLAAGGRCDIHSRPSRNLGKRDLFSTL